MSSLVYNPRTEQRLAQLAQQPPQSLLLVGAPGLGLMTAARQVASRTALILRPHTSQGHDDQQQHLVGHFHIVHPSPPPLFSVIFNVLPSFSCIYSLHRRITY